MTIHKSVLLKETIDGLNLKEGSVVVDATLGGGGHSLEILGKIGDTGKLVAIDQDAEAIENFKKEFRSKEDNLVLAKDNFSNLKEILKIYGVDSVDAILADLGFSSDQMEDAERGLSFQKNTLLDMRLDRENKLTAEKIVNGYSQENLEKIIKNYGEERFARSISSAIVNRRKTGLIKNTAELVEIIAGAVPARYRQGKIHFSTRTFQALRIAVNHELENLEKFLFQAVEVLKPGGRLVIISFHSLEDRIVKNIFRENARGCICPPNFPKCVCQQKAKIKIITKKPIIPNDLEIKNNPRSRSAKLRVCEKL